MGAWGIKTFENDDALDWIFGLEETTDLSLIESTLQLSEESYLESPDGCNILAAAEVILALQGEVRNDFPDTASNWVKKNSALDASRLIDLALSSLEKVLSDESELKELWEETEHYEQWKNDVYEIKSLLQSRQ